MNTFRADLHCHTTASDGSETPEKIIELAKKSGLSALSITDHDTVEAYATAIPLAKQAGLTLLTGIEFSTVLQQHSVHILGYGFRIDDSAIANLCKKHIDRRKNRNLVILELLKKQGISLEYSDLIDAIHVESPLAGRSIGRPHIAFALLKKGYIKTPQEAFNKYLGEDCPCFAQGDPISVDETIEAIHHAKGVAIIAHPHLIKDTALLNELLKKDFDGIECYYGKFVQTSHDRWLKIAQHRNWLVTGGSDFHGLAKPNLTLGCSWIGQDHFQKLIDRIG